MRVLREVRDLRRALRIGIGLRAVGGRHVVIDHQQRLLRRAHLAAGQAQALERLRARHLMHEVAVDIDQAGAVGLLVDQVVVPDLVVEGARLCHRRSDSSACAAILPWSRSRKCRMRRKLLVRQLRHSIRVRQRRRLDFYGGQQRRCGPQSTACSAGCSWIESPVIASRRHGVLTALAGRPGSRCGGPIVAHA